jgi:hypothetical protein
MPAWSPPGLVDFIFGRFAQPESGAVLPFRHRLCAGLIKSGIKSTELHCNGGKGSVVLEASGGTPACNRVPSGGHGRIGPVRAKRSQTAWPATIDRQVHIARVSSSTPQFRHIPKRSSAFGWARTFQAAAFQNRHGRPCWGAPTLEPPDFSTTWNSISPNCLAGPTPTALPISFCSSIKSLK